MEVAVTRSFFIIQIVLQYMNVQTIWAYRVLVQNVVASRLISGMVRHVKLKEALIRHVKRIHGVIH
jgi:hypothetical protein